MKHECPQRIVAFDFGQGLRRPHGLGWGREKSFTTSWGRPCPRLGDCCQVSDHVLVYPAARTVAQIEALSGLDQGIEMK
ncbi:MAG: hypothetical protein L0Z50_34580, partial [Verrucomicrobiales bacterium]|nr:hypothetical protein [Verrucomicrobiales bacterium]